MIRWQMHDDKSWCLYGNAYASLFVLEVDPTPRKT